MEWTPSVRLITASPVVRWSPALEDVHVTWRGEERGGEVRGRGEKVGQGWRRGGGKGEEKGGKEVEGEEREGRR